MKYILSHSQTRDTTGYFECLPDPEPEWQELRQLLEQRPNDVFLRKFALSKLLANESGSWIAALSSSVMAAGQRVTARLLLEAAAMSPVCAACLCPGLESLAALAADVAPALVSPCLSPDSREIAGSLRGNIHAHKDFNIAGIQSGLAGDDVMALAAAFSAGENILREEYVRLRASSPFGEEAIPNERETYARACAALEEQGIFAGPEMRHEASLCPIALLRQWHMRAGLGGAGGHELYGTLTAYGRGLTVARARVSCVMEIIERASAHAFAENDAHGIKIGAQALEHDTLASLLANGKMALDPETLAPGRGLGEKSFYWLAARDRKGNCVYVPAQAVYLFSNFDGFSCFEHIGSTGLASGSSRAMAKLAALHEIIERDAHATVPFSRDGCFELSARDQVIRGLLEDYRWRGIRVQFQDITTEIGVPAYRCFVYGPDGGVAQATGANLSGPKAALAALTETPWPYVWAKPVPAPSGAGLPDLPIRVLEDLPDFSLGSYDADLALLEAVLVSHGIEPLYADISRPELVFPVYRAFAPGLEADPELEGGPTARLLARCVNLLKVG